LRVVLKTDQVYACPVLDFTRRTGLVAQIRLEGESKALIDMNHVILSKALQIINDIIDEEQHANLSSCVDSIKVIKSIFVLVEYWIMQQKPKEINDFFSRIIHKLLSWTTSLNKNKFESEMLVSNLLDIVSLLQKHAQALTLNNLNLQALRDQNYLKLMKAFEGFSDLKEEGNLMLKCKEAYDGIVDKTDKNTLNINSSLTSRENQSNQNYLNSKDHSNQFLNLFLRYTSRCSTRKRERTLD